MQQRARSCACEGRREGVEEGLLELVCWTVWGRGGVGGAGEGEALYSLCRSRSSCVA